MKLKLLIILTFITSIASAQININNYIISGQAKIQSENYLGAIENFNIIIKFRPRLPEPYFYRALAKHQLEDFRGAIEDYTQAITIKPYYPSAYMNRALAYLELRNYEATIADYNKALELSPRDAGIYNNRGIAKMSMKDYDGAIEDYNTALELDPNSVNAYINRSNAYIAKGEIENAIRDINRTIIMRPHYSNAYLLRALARFELDDYASALRDFDQTIKLDPENAYAYNNRGIVKQELEDYEGAIMDYNLALQFNPTMANAYYNRGIAKEVLGRPGAEEDYMTAARLDPKLDMSKIRSSYEEFAQQAQQQYQNQKLQGQQTAQNQQQPNVQQQDDSQDNQQETSSDQQENSEEERQRRRFALSLADTRNLPTEEEDPGYGFIQNRNVIIELEEIFVLTTGDVVTDEFERIGYYNTVIEDLNASVNYSPQLNVTNREISEPKSTLMGIIQDFDGRIETNKSTENFLIRGALKMMVDDYNSALNDLDAALEEDSKNSLAYFSRANTRLKMVEVIESLPDYSENLTISLNGGNTNSSTTNEVLTDYNYILEDYENAVRNEPDFPFVYFNEAYVLCKLDRYEEALQKLNIAIEKQDNFAEAYFNRGLTKVYLDDIDGGALDLSKAGELGIENAYNIIKRYCN